MLLRSFHETVEPRRHRIDHLGAGLLAGLALAARPTASRTSAGYPATVEAESGAFFLTLVVTAAFTVVAAASLPSMPTQSRVA